MERSKSTSKDNAADIPVGTEPVALDDGTILRPFNVPSMDVTVMAEDAAHAVKVAKEVAKKQKQDASTKAGDE